MLGLVAARIVEHGTPSEARVLTAMSAAVRREHPGAAAALVDWDRVGGGAAARLRRPAGCRPRRPRPARPVVAARRDPGHRPLRSPGEPGERPSARAVLCHAGATMHRERLVTRTSSPEVGVTGAAACSSSSWGGRSSGSTAPSGYRYRSRKSWAVLAFLLLGERPPTRTQLAALLFAERRRPAAGAALEPGRDPPRARPRRRPRRRPGAADPARGHHGRRRRAGARPLARGRRPARPRRGPPRRAGPAERRAVRVVAARPAPPAGRRGRVDPARGRPRTSSRGDGSRRHATWRCARP